MATRLVACGAFLLGGALALFIEHVGLQSPARTMVFIGITVAIGWFGRLTFDHSDEPA
jgi:hypothetical protein